MTAINAPGIFLLIVLRPRMMTRTDRDTASVVMLVSGISSSVPKNAGTVPPVPPGTPSMPATWPIATWMPTPVRNPMRTLLDRKSARNPRRMIRAKSKNPAARIARMPASATYWAEPVVASPARPAAMIAAVAESAPTTRCREEPSSAKTAIGIRIVYRPVMTGMPAIFA